MKKDWRLNSGMELVWTEVNFWHKICIIKDKKDLIGFKNLSAQKPVRSVGRNYTCA
jgi:hypothetical protein